jgi:micrococcal nuclease
MAAMNCVQCHGILSARNLASALFALWLLPSGQAKSNAGTMADTATILPSCLPLADVHSSVTARVDDNGILILRDGRLVKPEGLLLPSAERTAASKSLHRESLTGIRSLVVGRRVSLHLGEPRIDRYRRLRAQIVVDSQLWLQREMLRGGWARVFISPDRHECSHELYAAEDEARQKRMGLWASDAFGVRTPDSLTWRDLGTFQIVQGEVANASVRGSRAYLNFGRDWRRDFTVTIAPNDMTMFRSEGVDPESYAGKAVRVRGWIDRLNGFEIEAAAPQQIEVLSGKN